MSNRAASFSRPLAPLRMAASSAPTGTSSAHTTAMSRVTAGNLGRGAYSGSGPQASSSSSKASSAQYSSPSTPKPWAAWGWICPNTPTMSPPL